MGETLSGENLELTSGEEVVEGQVEEDTEVEELENTENVEESVVTE